MKIKFFLFFLGLGLSFAFMNYSPSSYFYTPKTTTYPFFEKKTPKKKPPTSLVGFMKKPLDIQGHSLEYWPRKFFIEGKGSLVVEGSNKEGILKIYCDFFQGSFKKTPPTASREFFFSCSQPSFSQQQSPTWSSFSLLRKKIKTFFSLISKPIVNNKKPSYSWEKNLLSLLQQQENLNSQEGFFYAKGSFNNNNNNIFSFSKGKNQKNNSFSKHQEQKNNPKESSKKKVVFLYTHSPKDYLFPSITKNSSNFFLKVCHIQDFQETFRLQGTKVLLFIQEPQGIVENFSLFFPNFPFLQGDSLAYKGSIVRGKNILFSGHKPQKEEEKPFWYLKARSLTFNRDTSLLSGHHVSFYIKDTPLMHIPFFSTYMKPRSGFLTPTFGSARQKNFYLGFPYYKRFSSRKDVTLTPYLFFHTGLVGHGVYRQCGERGLLKLEGCLTTPTNIPSSLLNFLPPPLVDGDENSLNHKHNNKAFLFNPQDSFGLQSYEKNTRGFFEGRGFFQPRPQEEIFLKEYWISDPVFFYHFPLFGHDQDPYIESHSSWKKYFPQHRGYHSLALESYHYHGLLTQIFPSSPVIFPKIAYESSSYETFHQGTLSVKNFLNSLVFWYPEKRRKNQEQPYNLLAYKSYESNEDSSQNFIHNTFNNSSNNKEEILWIFQEEIPEVQQQNRWRLAGKTEISWTSLPSAAHRFYAAFRLQGMTFSEFSHLSTKNSPSLQEEPEKMFFPYFFPQVEISWEKPFRTLFLKTKENTGFLSITPKIQYITSFFSSQREFKKEATYFQHHDGKNTIFSALTLFYPNRYPGWDVFDEGSRLNYGLKAQWASGEHQGHVVLGQSYSFHESFEPLPYLGAPKGFSNVVASLSLTKGDYGFSYDANFPLKEEGFFFYHWECFGSLDTFLGPLQWSSGYIYSKNFINHHFSSLYQHYKKPKIFQDTDILSPLEREHLEQSSFFNKLPHENLYRPYHQWSLSFKIPLGKSFFLKTFLLMDLGHQEPEDVDEEEDLVLWDQDGSEKKFTRIFPSYGSEDYGGDDFFDVQRTSFFLEKGFDLTYETESLEFGLSIHHYSYSYKAFDLYPGFIITFGLRLKDLGQFQSPSWSFGGNF